MNQGTHIISRQNIHLKVIGMGVDVVAIKNKIETVCADELPVRLNAIFEKYEVGENVVIRIPKLDVSLLVQDENLTAALSRNIAEKVEQELKRQLEQKTTNVQNIEEVNSFEALLHYVRKGFLPWWWRDGKSHTSTVVLNKLFETQGLKTVLETFSKLRLNEDGLHRLSQMISPEHLTELLKTHSNITGNKTDDLLEDMNAIGKQLVNQFDQSAFFQLSKGVLVKTFLPHKIGWDLYKNLAALVDAKMDRTLGNDVLKELIQNLKTPAFKSLLLSLPEFKNAVSLTSIFLELPFDLAKQSKTNSSSTNQEQTLTNKDQSSEDKHKKDDLEDGERAITYAGGLVLLANFLPTLFANLGLYKEGILHHKSIAIAIMRHLVFSLDKYEEHEVILEKLLCGVSTDTFISTASILSVEQKLEADLLLSSVIEHWAALKSTSISGLQEGFLQRKGKLQFNNKQWNLSMQRQTIDVLLDYLPWSYSMIKLPWMPKILTVKW